MVRRIGLIRFMAACFALVLALALMEGGLRLFWIKRATIDAGIEDPHFHHRLKPSQTHHYATDEFDVSIKTNRLGLRGREPILPKPDGVIRILIMGDSFTYGFPVKDEEAFCFLIERGLKEQGYPVEVINGGVSGYSPTLHFISLRDQFIDFEPDLVVLWYDLGDLREDYWYQKNLIYDADGAIVRCDPRYVNGRFDRGQWMRDHSAIVKYWQTKVARTFDKIRILGLGNYVRLKTRGGRAKAAIAKLKAEQQAQDAAEYDRFLLVNERMNQDQMRPHFELSARYLSMMGGLLSERDIPLVLGIYPYGMVAGPDQWAEGRRFWGFEKGRVYSAQAAVSLFEEFTRAERIPLVNTFESFREAAGHEKLFYDWDGHFTPAGHRVLASHFVSDLNVKTLLDRLEDVVEGR